MSSRCFRQSRSLVVGIAAVLATAGTPVGWAAKSGSNNASSSPTLDWTLTKHGCADPRAAVTVSCGSYGQFHADLPSDTSCVVLARGIESGLAVYSAPKKVKEWTGPLQPASLAVTTSSPGVSVIDFGVGDHGASVQGLVESLNGSSGAVELLAIDSPALAAFGSSPNDMHVVAQICSILEAVDVAGETAPYVANLSFGRMAGTTDPINPATCDANTASCQLLRVLEQVRERGTVIVAAGGNHRLQLFPAISPDVLAAGALRTRALLNDNVAEPSWETPERMDAYLISHGLCLEGDWPAPAGTSYAAATLSGLLAQSLFDDPEFDPYKSLAPLTPLWIDEQQCFALHEAGTPIANCNLALTDLYLAIDQSNPWLCWNSVTLDVAAASDVTPSFAPRSSPAFPSYVAKEVTPAPEEDPCLPCIEDDDPPVSNDLHIDFSFGAELDFNKFVDRVQLRAGSSYYTLTLSPSARSAIKAGTLDRLTIPNGKQLVAGAGQPSLVFTIFAAGSPIPPDANSGAKCPGSALGGGSCYWTSTPILLSSP